MEQIFVHHFIHCDPHPGNLFVRPLPGRTGRKASAGATPGGAGRPFQIAFVDFGMTMTIPERLREALLGRGDRRRHPGRRCGWCGPTRTPGCCCAGADLRRIEQVHRELFDRFWGVKLADIQGVAFPRSAR